MSQQVNSLDLEACYHLLPHTLIQLVVYVSVFLEKRECVLGLLPHYLMWSLVGVSK